MEQAPTQHIFSFEEKESVIDGEIAKRRGRWFLDSMAHIGFDDVSQIIRTHIHRKWHLWDQNQALEPWINRIISNQIKNLIRNHYGAFAKPCIKCPFNESADTDGNECSYTESKTQCSECPLFAKWSKSKKDAYNVKLPKSFDAHDFEIQDSNSAQFDMEAAASTLHEKMKKYLNKRQYEAYELIIVQGLEDGVVAEKLGLKISERGKSDSFNKRIKQLKRLFVTKAKEALENEDVINF